MIQYIPVILLCTIGTPVDQCEEANLQTSSVIRGEATVDVKACLGSAQTLMKSSGAAPARGRHYFKIRCVPQDTP